MWVAKLLALSVLLAAASTGVAWAHVEVSPDEVPPGSTQSFTLEVPTERDVPTTEVRVEIPEGFEVSNVEYSSGFTGEPEEDGSGVVTAITWTGGRSPRRRPGSSSSRRGPPRAQASSPSLRSRPTRTARRWSGPAPPAPRTRPP